LRAGARPSTKLADDAAKRPDGGRQAGLTKLSGTRLRSAFSKSISSLLPSISANWHVQCGMTQGVVGADGRQKCYEEKRGSRLTLAIGRIEI